MTRFDSFCRSFKVDYFVLLKKYLAPLDGVAFPLVKIVTLCLTDELIKQARVGNSMRHQRDIRGGETNIPTDRQTDRRTDRPS